MAVKRKLKPQFYVMMIAIVLVIVTSINAYFTMPMDRKDDSIIVVEIPSGTSSKMIGKILEDNNLIRNKTYFTMYTKIFTKKPLKASTYEFSKNMSLIKIIHTLEEGNNYNPNDLKMTFKEGQRITQYAEVVGENTKYSSEDFINKINNRDYLQTLISKYWFLTNTILDGRIYYPLEGYLAPNTYFFNKDVELEEIIETLLNEEEKKLEKYKNKLNENNIHETLTMASIVELEGTNTENRKDIVGVFKNRLSINMNLGSDVTTYYALQLPLTQDLNANQFSVDNPYNTRSTTMMGKMPVGPICNPSESSIDASTNPHDHEYIYFVADKHGNIFFTKTLKEHENKIAEIKAKGDWIW